MTKKKKQNSKVVFIIILLALACAIITGGIKYYLDTRQNPSQSPSVESTNVASEEDTLSPQVVIYLAKTLDTGTYLVPVKVDYKGKQSQMDFAINALIKARETKNGSPVMPAGTKLLNPITIKDNTAFVDFSQAFVDNFSGGSDMEALTINAIAHTVVANSDDTVEKIKILVEGKDAETLGGHLELFDPIVPSSVLLAPKK